MKYKYLEPIIERGYFEKGDIVNLYQFNHKAACSVEMLQKAINYPSKKKISATSFNF